MYCPNCGRENAENQKFCTSCGCKLPVMAGIERPVQLTPIYTQPEPKIWQNPVIYALFITVVGMFLMMLGRRVDRTIMNIGTIITLIGAGLMGLKGIFLILQQAGILQFPKHDTHLQQVQSIHMPSIPSGEPVSVIEHTTRHLDAVPLYESRRNTQPTLK